MSVCPLTALFGVEVENSLTAAAALGLLFTGLSWSFKHFIAFKRLPDAIACYNLRELQACPTTWSRSEKNGQVLSFPWGSREVSGTYQEERLGPRASGGLWDVEEGEILSINLGFRYYFVANLGRWMPWLGDRRAVEWVATRWGKETSECPGNTLASASAPLVQPLETRGNIRLIPWIHSGIGFMWTATEDCFSSNFGRTGSLGFV